MVTRRAIATAGIALTAACLAGCALAEPRLPPGPPVALRVEQFTVPPATGPTSAVWVENLWPEAWTGSIRVDFGDRWRVAQPPAGRRIGAGAVARIPFTVEQAKAVEANRYPVQVTAVGEGRQVVRDQTVVCASAPYGKVTVDGREDEWDIAIPVRFATGGKSTVIRTLWTRRTFSLLVAAQEEAHKPMKGPGPCDAVQVAVSPWPSQTPGPGRPAVRAEFLLAVTDRGPLCFRLARPGEALEDQPAVADLGGRIVPRAELAVVRRGELTLYEWSIPFETLETVRPAPGRTFCFSLLVHDPDGTGLRDWGEAAGLWKWQRNRRAWTSWPGAVWPKDPPFDNKIEWGLCSSAQ